MKPTIIITNIITDDIGSTKSEPNTISTGSTPSSTIIPTTTTSAAAEGERTAPKVTSTVGFQADTTSPSSAPIMCPDFNVNCDKTCVVLDVNDCLVCACPDGKERYDF